MIDVMVAVVATVVVAVMVAVTMATMAVFMATVVVIVTIAIAIVEVVLVYSEDSELVAESLAVNDVKRKILMQSKCLNRDTMATK